MQCPLDTVSNRVIGTDEDGVNHVLLEATSSRCESLTDRMSHYLGSEQHGIVYISVRHENSESGDWQTVSEFEF